MDQSLLGEAKAKFIEIVSAEYPELDIRKGTAINELMINFAALGYALIYEEITKIEEKLYLKDILASPTDIDSSMIDGIISNFYITRSPGAKSKGMIKIVFSESRDYYIPDASSFVLESKNYLYYTTSAHDITTDDLLYDSVNDQYYYLLEVEAENIGPEYFLESEMALEPQVLTGYIESAEVYEDFAQGVNQETDQSLLDRVKDNLSNRGLFSHQSIEATLREAFPAIRQVTVAGYNDHELQRGYNISGIKTGGKVDVYVRDPVDGHLQGVIEATSDASGVIDIPSAYCPILRVKNVAQKSNPGLEYENFTLTSTSDVHERFSSEETLQLTVPADLIATPVLISVDYAPGIQDVQTFVDDDDNRYVMADILVKTYMPCFVEIGISYRTGVIGTDMADTIKSTLLEYINSYSDDVLYASRIVNVLHGINITNIELPISLRGTFYLPDGTTEEIDDPNYLRVSDNLSLGVSPRTYRFFISSSDIAIERI
jgi:hypothetical protein